MRHAAQARRGEGSTQGEQRSPPLGPCMCTCMRVRGMPVAMLLLLTRRHTVCDNTHRHATPARALKATTGFASSVHAPAQHRLMGAVTSTQAPTHCTVHVCVCRSFLPAQESGPVYLLPTGPASSFLVISDPQAAKHVLRGTDNATRNV